MARNPGDSGLKDRLKQGVKDNFDSILGVFLGAAATFTVLSLSDTIGLVWSVIASVVTGLLTFLLIIYLKSVFEEYWEGKWRIFVVLIVCSLTIIPLAFVIIYQFLTISNQGDTLATVIPELTHSAERITELENRETSEPVANIESRIKESLQAEHEATVEAMQAEFDSTTASLQATIDSQAVVIASEEEESLEESVKNVIRGYFDLLSKNEFEIAWNEFLTPRIQQSIITKYSQEAYLTYWDDKEIRIEEFIDIDFNWDKSSSTVTVSVTYYENDYPDRHIDTIVIIWNEEANSWLIDRFGEQRIMS